MEFFYRLPSLFALESFLSSQCTCGNAILREVSVFFGICSFLLGLKAKSTKFMFCKIFHAMQFISSFLFPVLKSSSPANEVNQVSQL